MNNPERKSLHQIFPKHIEIPTLVIFSAILLGYGIFLPLMKVEQMVFWKTEYSVLTGIQGLFKQEEYFLCALLFLFSLIFPVIKLATLWILWQFRFADETRNKILHWLGLLGKWSMLDVFVVAILIVAVKLGPVASVTPRIGIYVFSLAIILSILTTLWTEHLIKRGNA